MAQEQSAKIKKKQWFQILAPQQFDNIVIGETLVTEPQLMIGKQLSQSLMNLSNDVKRQNIHIHFKVVGIDGNNGKTSIIGYKIVSSSVKRFVRRNSEKIDLSFICETSDNMPLTVKPLLVTRAEVKGSVAAKLRQQTIGFLAKSIKKMTYDEVLASLISHKLQDSMKENLNKIYPLKVCEIRYLGIKEIRKPQEAKIELTQ